MDNNYIFAVTGGGIFGLLSKNNRFGRNPVVMLGIVVHFIAFYLIFCNIPNDAPIASMEGTDSIAFMEPRYVFLLLLSRLFLKDNYCIYIFFAEVANENVANSQNLELLPICGSFFLLGHNHFAIMNY